MIRCAAAASAAILLSASASLAASPATTGIYAPLDRQGPALSVSHAQVEAALSCHGNLADPAHVPILLVPGTDTTPQTAFSWNYERAFAAEARPFCGITLPGNALLDIQTAGQYIVGAIRTLYARDQNRRIAIVGWSQGGMVPRWALRFWPDTRRMVASVIALDPSNHGTTVAVATCDTMKNCAPADWQQASNARFIAALNSGAETFAGIAYTVIYSRDDEVVVPNLNNSGSSSLHTGGGRIADIAVQAICPADASEHLAMGTYDPVGYALVIDALDHPMPANPADIPASVCLQTLQPGVDPATFAQSYAGLLASIAAAGQAAPTQAAEPPLAGYVFR